jgi:hypothetical protein
VPSPLSFVALTFCPPLAAKMTVSPLTGWPLEFVTVAVAVVVEVPLATIAGGLSCSPTPYCSRSALPEIGLSGVEAVASIAVIVEVPAVVDEVRGGAQVD